jgi:membrane-associated protein
MGRGGDRREARPVDIQHWLDTLLDTLDAIPPAQLYLVLGLLLVLETTMLVGLVVPGEVALLAAATTVHSPAEYLALAGVAAAASVVGQSGGYLIGRRFGPRLRASRAGRRIGEEHWLRAERVLRGGTGRAIVASRFLAVAHSLVPVIAGTLRMPLRRFAPYTALGAVVWGLVYVGVGSAASVAVRHSAHLIGPVFTAVAAVAVVALVVAGKVRARRRAAGAAIGPAPLP